MLPRMHSFSSWSWSCFCCPTCYPACCPTCCPTCCPVKHSCPLPPLSSLPPTHTPRCFRSLSLTEKHQESHDQSHDARWPVLATCDEAEKCSNSLAGEAASTCSDASNDAVSAPSRMSLLAVMETTADRQKYYYPFYYHPFYYYP